MGVTVAVTRVAANTSTGTQDITTADLGGLTPKAVLLIATRGVTDGTAVDGAGFYIGASDGTNEWTHGYESQHAQASMDVDMESDTTADRILTIYDGTADAVVEATADFDSFITDGVRIDWTDAPASAFLVTAVFFAGTDLSVHVGTQSLGNTADALIDISSIGFEADLVFTALAEGADESHGAVSLGCIHNNRAGTVTQRAISHQNRNAFGTASNAVMMRDDDCVVKIQSPSNALDFFGTAGSFDSSGFSVQLGNGRAPVNQHIRWLALRLGNSPVVSSKVYTYSTPTSTGSNTDSTPDFTPQFVMYLANRAAAVDTLEVDADGGTIGVVMADADDVYTQSISDEDGAADSNTQSLSDDRINLPTHTGASGHEATLTSFGATGPVWNFGATDGTARLWPALAIGANAGGTQYDQSASGAVTPAGTITKQTATAKAGTLTSVGVLTRIAAKVLSGALSSIVGALNKATTKTFEGELTSEGAMDTVKTFLKSLEGAITPAGALIKSTAKSLAGAFTSSGTTAKGVSKSLTGAMASAGTSAKETTKAAAGLLTPSGGIVKSVGKAIAGTLTSSGAIVRSISKSLAGAISSIVGSLAAESSAQPSFSVGAANQISAGYDQTLSAGIKETVNAGYKGNVEA